MENKRKLIVEFDRDGLMLNAEMWESIGQVEVLVRQYKTVRAVNNLISQMRLVDSGRWDGETSTALCKAYNGRSCTTGGLQEVYEN